MKEKSVGTAEAAEVTMKKKRRRMMIMIMNLAIILVEPNTLLDGARPVLLREIMKLQ